MSAAAALLALFLGAARAEDGEPSEIPVDVALESSRSKAVVEMRKELARDPALQEALVERVMKSKIADAVSVETDYDKKRAAIRDWVRSDSDSPSQVALGLLKDDKDGTNRYETMMIRYKNIYFLRKNTDRGAFGTLKGAAKTSKKTGLPEQEAGAEEQREALRTLFEGHGSQGEKVITGDEGTGGSAAATSAAAPPSAALANSFYDRLSAGNIRGYSPQLMALQSALNTRRPPGAPALIETGKLDHATLSYPAYGLKYDLGNVQERLRRARIAELATLGGVQLTERDMKDPGLEARLLEKVSLDKLPERFAARSAANARAAAALAAFEAAAAQSKDPNLITKALLVELSGRQREAARWLTAASLEEELARIDAEEGFLTADLLAAIDAVPAAAPIRESYKRRGEDYKERLAKLKANALRSLDALRSETWLARIAEIEGVMAESQRLRRNISRDISDYRLVPYRVAEAVLRQPRWREFLDDLLVRYLKSTSYGREVANRRGRLSRFLGIFGQIASGDLEGAHLTLVNAEPGRR